MKADLVLSRLLFSFFPISSLPAYASRSSFLPFLPFLSFLRIRAHTIHTDPHRNKLYGRETTKEEQAWLDDTDSMPVWARSQYLDIEGWADIPHRADSEKKISLDKARAAVGSNRKRGIVAGAASADAAAVSAESPSPTKQSKGGSDA